MLDTTLNELRRHRVSEAPKAVIADAGYWHAAQMQAITERGIEVLVPPDGNMREGKRPGWENGLYDLMPSKLSSERGRKLYAQRKISVEPVYGHQTQPPDRPVHATRQNRGAIRVAVGCSNPQSAQAAQPLDR